MIYDIIKKTEKKTALEINNCECGGSPEILEDNHDFGPWRFTIRCKLCRRRSKFEGYLPGRRHRKSAVTDSEYMSQKRETVINQWNRLNPLVRYGLRGSICRKDTCPEVYDKKILMHVVSKLSKNIDLEKMIENAKLEIDEKI